MCKRQFFVLQPQTRVFDNFLNLFNLATRITNSSMKRLSLLLLALLCVVVVAAQQRTLRVSYASVSKISAAIEVSGYSDEVKKQLEEELKKHTEQRETSTLLQSGTRSSYTIVEDKSVEPLLTKGNSSLEGVNSFKLGNVQSIYLDLEAKERLTQKAFTDKPLVIKEELTASPQWKIGTETTAWFCKEIAVPFGPEGLYGLPGLILETEINSKITTATKVEYISQSQSLLAPKGKMVTPEQYEKMMEEALTRFLETNEDTEWEIKH